MSQNKYPRGLAVRILTQVLSEGQALDEVLAKASSPSIAWLQDVCSGTLRWKGRLDFILDSVALKKKPSGWLRKMLLVASYQLIVQDRVAAARVVSETVDEIKSKEGEAPGRFANACLRKIADHALQWRNLPPPSENEKESAAWASLPEWFWAKIIRQQNVSWAEAYAQASLERPVLWIRSKNSEWIPDWAKPGPIPFSFQVTEAGHISERPGFEAGEFIVQDISSQTLIAEVAQHVQSQHSGKIFKALDLCAAPGGKTVGLAWSGFQVTATDHNPSRVLTLKETLARTSPETQLIPWEDWQKTESPDLIWLDAPCSGTGILRRHPDVRWLRQEKDLSSLIQIQRELLKKAWDHLKPGSYLVYSVCSVLKEEGIDALKKTELEKFTQKQWLLAPQNVPFGDGFWAALLLK